MIAKPIGDIGVTRRRFLLCVINASEKYRFIVNKMKKRFLLEKSYSAAVYIVASDKKALTVR